jgi:NTE family protein
VAGRALVLGGGGVTGISWEVGILAGLADGGVDLTEADLIVATSAGSVVAAQLTTAPLASVYRKQLRVSPTEGAARMSLATTVELAVAAREADDEVGALQRIGAFARAAPTMPEAKRRAVIARRLPVSAWPERRLIITAVSADDGEFVTFTRDSGVSLLDAVVASCAVPGVWPPSNVNGRLFLDGGLRSPANVDLVTGQTEPYDRVVVIAPIAVGFRPERSVAAQVAALPVGTRSVVVAPDAAAKEAIGRNLLDPSRRPEAARAGRRQASAVRDEVAAVWHA